MILVTGATGQIGKEVVGQLAGAGIPCRVMVRDPVKAAGLQLQGVEVVRGDFTDAASVDAALRDVDHALLSSAFDPQAVQTLRRLRSRPSPSPATWRKIWCHRSRSDFLHTNR